MKPTTPDLAERLAQLRADFDGSFALAPSPPVAALERMLAIRVAGDRYALDLREIEGVIADRPVTALPATRADFLGLTSHRSAIVPVYDLRTILGYPGPGGSRWMILVRGSSALALAFEALEEVLDVAPGALTDRDAPQATGHLRGIVRTGGVARPIVHLPSILDALRTHVAGGSQQKSSP